MRIALADTDAEIEPLPTDSGGGKCEPDLDRLSNILKSFNERFGTTFTDSDRIFRHIRDDIAPKVAADAGFQNAKANTPHTARLAHHQRPDRRAGCHRRSWCEQLNLLNAPADSRLF